MPRHPSSCPNGVRCGTCSRCASKGPSHGNPSWTSNSTRASHAAGVKLAGRRLLRRRWQSTASGRSPDVEGSGPSSRAATRAVAGRHRGQLHVPARRAGSHGPVRVADSFHFATPTAPGTARSAPPRTPGRTRATNSRSRRCETLAAAPFTRCGCASSRSRTSTTRTSRSTTPSPGRWPTDSTSTGSTRRSSGTSSSASRSSGAGHRGRPDPVPPLRPLGLLRPSAPAVDDRYLRYVVAPARRLPRTSGGRWRTSTTCCVRKTRRTGSGSLRSSARRTPSGTCYSIHNCRPFYDYSQALGHPLQHPARRRLSHRREHRRVARALGKARRHRRVRLRGRHRPGLGQHHRRGDGAPVLGRRRPRRLRRPRRDVHARPGHPLVGQGR